MKDEMDYGQQHPAIAVLREFFREMHAWELELLAFEKLQDATAQDYSEHVRQQRAKLGGIFAKYCQAGIGAKRLKDQGVSYMGGDAEYDPERERVEKVEVTPNKVVVFTRQTHAYHFRLRYELSNVGDKWLIRDNRKSSLGFEDKWRNYPL